MANRITVEQALLRQLVLLHLEQSKVWLPVHEIDYYSQFTKATVDAKIAELRRRDILSIRYHNLKNGGLKRGAICLTLTGQAEAMRRVSRVH